MKIFKETQRFNQWWFITIEIIVLLLVVFDFFKEFNQIKMGNSNKSITILAVSVIFVVLTIVFIHSLKLKTRIDEKGVSYQFFPVHLKTRIILWTDLSKCYVRKYSPIAEYGGWGIRGLSKKGLLGFRGKGKAYNIRGNMGIQLEFRDGTRLLIGTQNSEKVRLTINNYIHKMNSNNSIG